MEKLKKPLIVDASVVLKWFIPEEGTEDALKLRDRHLRGHCVLAAPELLSYEVANVLRYHPDISDDMVREDIEALFDIGLVLVPTSVSLLDTAVRIARRFNISVYDASYLALGMEVNAPVITADTKLCHTVGDHLECKSLTEWVTKGK